jgi:transposase
VGSILKHRNKKNGDIYVYSSDSYWDKEKKAPRTRQVYLGKLDPETGELIPARRRMPRKNKTEPPPSASPAASQAEPASQAVKDSEPQAPAAPAPASVKVVGPSLILEQLADETGLAALLRRCWPLIHAQILSLVFFIVQKGLPLSRCQSWSQWTLHPAQEQIVSQRVSELLQGISEEDRQRFLSQWLATVPDGDLLCYDITSISSYAKGNEYIRRGYNRDGDNLPQLNLAMLFGQNSGLPVYYRRMPGNISDVATLKTTLKSLDFLGANHGLHLVLDRGFYSHSNVDELLSRRHHFTMAVPSGRKWVEGLIDGHHDTIIAPQNTVKTEGGETVYAVTELYKWGEQRRRVYLHIYHNAHRAADAFEKFTAKILQYKEELESNKTVPAHEEAYRRFFIIKQTPKRGRKICFNNAAIQKHRQRYAGFFCLMSDSIKDPVVALEVYRNKDIVENCFDDLKNQLDMKRLRVHSSQVMDSRIFLQFLALIIISAMRRTIAANEPLKNMTVRDIMEAMEPMVQIKFQGRYGAVSSELSPLQRSILQAFKLPCSS